MSQFKLIKVLHMVSSHLFIFLAFTFGRRRRRSRSGFCFIGSLARCEALPFHGINLLRDDDKMCYHETWIMITIHMVNWPCQLSSILCNGVQLYDEFQGCSLPSVFKHFNSQSFFLQDSKTDLLFLREGTWAYKSLYIGRSEYFFLQQLR